jgi:hypothetical protein
MAPEQLEDTLRELQKSQMDDEGDYWSSSIEQLRTMNDRLKGIEEASKVLPAKGETNVYRILEKTLHAGEGTEKMGKSLLSGANKMSESISSLVNEFKNSENFATLSTSMDKMSDVMSGTFGLDQSTAQGYLKTDGVKNQLTTIQESTAFTTKSAVDGSITLNVVHALPTDLTDDQLTKIIEKSREAGMDIPAGSQINVYNTVTTKKTANQTGEVK